MKLFILNKDFEIEGMLEEYNSVEWVRRYDEPGDFVLSAVATTEEITGTIGLLKEDYYIAREDDEMIVQIEKKNLTTSAEQGNNITVSGRSIEKVLGQRIVWTQTNTKASETVEDFIRRLIDENAIHPTDPKRKIPKLTLGERMGFLEKLEKQITGDNLLEVVQELCKTYGYGFKITMNDSGLLEFVLYKGVDRSYKQSENPYIVFSSEFDNLINTEYEYDKTNHRNVALIGGEGEGKDRKYQTIGESEGMERYELFVDAKDVSSNNGEITQPEYNKLLVEKGMEKLAESATTENYEGEIETENTYVYKEDYNIGDIVEVENEYKMQASTRVTEIIESDNENGYRAVPTFGTWEV